MPSTGVTVRFEGAQATLKRRSDLQASIAVELRQDTRLVRAEDNHVLLTSAIAQVAQADVFRMGELFQGLINEFERVLPHRSGPALEGTGSVPVRAQRSGGFTHDTLVIDPTVSRCDRTVTLGRPDITDVQIARATLSSMCAEMCNPTYDAYVDLLRDMMSKIFDRPLPPPDFAQLLGQE